MSWANASRPLPRTPSAFGARTPPDTTRTPPVNVLAAARSRVVPPPCTSRVTPPDRVPDTSTPPLTAIVPEPETFPVRPVDQPRNAPQAQGPGPTWRSRPNVVPAES